MGPGLEDEGWLGDETAEMWFRAAQAALAEDSEAFWHWCELVEQQMGERD